MQIYLVGGAVRDALLGYPVYDHDWVVVGATPQQMEAQGFKPVGSDFPVFIHPETGEEYALARTERKSGKGYGGFTWHASPDVSLEDDLIRRDLTINAMARSAQGEVIDPYQGQQDLQNKLLRHVSPAFAEDPLRVLRVARFAARYAHLGFRVAEETLTLMQQIAATDELQHLTAERVWKETERALAEPSPHVYLQVMSDCHALPQLLPVLTPLFNDGVFSARLSNQLQRLSSNEASPEGNALANSDKQTKCNKQAKRNKQANGDKLAQTEEPVKSEDRVTDKEQVTGEELARIRFALLLCQATDTQEMSVAQAQIKQTCQQLRSPKHYCELALHCRQWHQTLASFQQQDGQNRLALIQGLDLLRRPQRLDALLHCCRALHGDGIDQAARQLPVLLAQINQLNPQALMAEGFKGKALGDELKARQLRICSHI